MIDSHVLVLNRFFFPIDTTSVKRAFLMLYGGSAKAVNLDYETFDFNSWSEISATNEDDCIKTVSTVIKIPRVIMVIRYDKVPVKEGAQFLFAVLVTKSSYGIAWPCY